MPLLLAAPDKFRGMATAAEVAGALCRGAAAVGWRCDPAPVTDGGEGILEALGGRLRRTRVQGPLGEVVDAEWRLLDGQGPSGPSERGNQGPSGPSERGDQGPSGPSERGDQGPSGSVSGVGRVATAVIEMARAAGLDLVGGPEWNDPLRASTAGVGQL
ncbi:MAG: glycerate kinase, partial [Actinobacteria bacterium]|nr:glycerate kinase [Actinomycetota bacterium]